MTGRAETIASRDRIGRLAEKLDAVIILQHEPADIAKLPAFPAAARIDERIRPGRRVMK